jgi:8-oxo-dGTP diphosphatase
MKNEYRDQLRPKGAIGVYIVENGKILLFLRKSKHANGTWCPPGGHIEYGESFLQSAQRETKEEAGIEIKDIEILGVTSDVYEAENKHYITVHTKPTSFSGQPALMEPEKFSEMKWFDLSQLPENLFPANKNFLAQNPPCLCGSGRNFNECHGVIRDI